MWCCLHQKNRKNTNLSSGYGSSLSTSRVPQQICLYPSAKPNVGTATMIQPEVSQIITNKACGGCGTPVRCAPLSGSGMASPVMSGGSSNAGTPNPGTPTLTGSGTPVHTPPLRLKKGLLERYTLNFHPYLHNQHLVSLDTAKMSIFKTQRVPYYCVYKMYPCKRYTPNNQGLAEGWGMVCQTNVMDFLSRLSSGECIINYNNRFSTSAWSANIMLVFFSDEAQMRPWR